jgi:hypothetical protein
MLQEFKAWHNEVIARRVVTALINNHFNALYCRTRQEACDQIVTSAPANARIGAGGSQTIVELNILEQLKSIGHTVLNHNQPGLTGEQKAEIRLQQLTCDLFLTGTNALTLDGKLVNTDGAGNRVAAMIYGPKKVIVVAGINKIVKDVAAAEQRIKSIAAPLNNKRLGIANPCVQTGECMDCQGSGRICNVTTIISKKPVLTDMTVLVVGEELGF